MLAPFLAAFRFARIPVKALAGPIEPRSRHVFQLDVFRHDYVRLWPGAFDTEFEVLDADPVWRQVVLRVREPRRRYERLIARRGPTTRDTVARLARDLGGRVLRGSGCQWVIECWTPPEQRRYLCGFDERLFIAQLPEGDTIAEAHLALKPGLVRLAPPADVHRQGEWFFLTASIADAALVDAHAAKFRRSRRLQAPIERSDRPHVTDELVRIDVRERRGRHERRTLLAFGRGRVRHPDHRDLVLTGWHRILRNRAIVAKGPDRERLRWID